MIAAVLIAVVYDLFGGVGDGVGLFVILVICLVYYMWFVFA